MREPTKAMVDPGYDTVHSCIDHYCYDSGSGYTIEPFAPTEIWQAMIDAALNEEGEFPKSRLTRNNITATQGT